MSSVEIVDLDNEISSNEDVEIVTESTLEIVELGDKTKNDYISQHNNVTNFDHRSASINQNQGSSILNGKITNQYCNATSQLNDRTNLSHQKEVDHTTLVLPLDEYNDITHDLSYSTNLQNTDNKKACITVGHKTYLNNRLSKGLFGDSKAKNRFNNDNAKQSEITSISVSSANITIGNEKNDNDTTIPSISNVNRLKNNVNLSMTLSEEISCNFVDDTHLTKGSNSSHTEMSNLSVPSSPLLENSGFNNILQSPKISAKNSCANSSTHIQNAFNNKRKLLDLSFEDINTLSRNEKQYLSVKKKSKNSSAIDMISSECSELCELQEKNVHNKKGCIPSWRKDYSMEQRNLNFGHSDSNSDESITSPNEMEVMNFSMHKKLAGIKKPTSLRPFTDSAKRKVGICDSLSTGSSSDDEHYKLMNELRHRKEREKETKDLPHIRHTNGMNKIKKKPDNDVLHGSLSFMRNNAPKGTSHDFIKSCDKKSTPSGFRSSSTRNSDDEYDKAFGLFDGISVGKKNMTPPTSAASKKGTDKESLKIDLLEMSLHTKNNASNISDGLGKGCFLDHKVKRTLAGGISDGGSKLLASAEPLANYNFIAHARAYSDEECKNILAGLNQNPVLRKKLTDVNRVKRDNEEIFSEIVMEFNPKVLLTFKENDVDLSSVVPCKVREHYDTNRPSIKFKRAVTSIYDLTHDIFFPCAEKVVEEQFIILFYDAVDFFERYANEKVSILHEFRYLQKRYMRVVIILNKFKAFKRLLSNNINKKYIESVRNALSSVEKEGSSLTNMNKDRKRGNPGKEDLNLEPDDLGAILNELMVNCGVHVFPTVNHLDFIEWIKHIVLIIGRSRYDPLVKNIDYAHINVKSGQDPKNVLEKSLEQLNLITTAKAKRVTNLYPSFQSLLDGVLKGDLKNGPDGKSLMTGNAADALKVLLSSNNPDEIIYAH
ncbi:uncharacterized protein SCODWIG_01555 [Saccharomycodes ludwigii]|uniref:ERCC4 domain-containing protein n=1 Tax=Saccharomycodes ludwigii TaxID=36035 RepID=A0A376B5P4_9ASCO|nr:uncharacterized protein SCODWIG_01555 [Saccharomycodes ludwigii]